ncbi:MAG: universal stress protein [Geminicoccaceae bacterium]|nr:universal stress protein [Geminicoccaceae bacterium]MCS7269263.1 universal stress protein [Geminicoccaceae bacterium]MCX7629986.1 universal stress protein [Geminicoccaceae bacterium]MDW8124688.1 universal stress protein [Geminicoccaceae bacterium]MDW8342521.1 universal stress protein [Geminicoccaceae bacterium]
MKTILAAVDGSEPAWKALEIAADLARFYGARLHVLHVLPVEPVPEGLLAFARAENIPLEEEIGRYESERLAGDAILREAAERARAKGVAEVETTAEEGSPAPVIVAAAERLGADLVVLGSRGRTGLLAGLLGSVALEVARKAKASVLVVR